MKWCPTPFIMEISPAIPMSYNLQIGQNGPAKTGVGAIMRIHILALCALLATPLAFAANPEHAKSVQAWRDKAEQGLRRDNGWLTLAGRFPMKPGVNTFGTGE